MNIVALLPARLKSTRIKEKLLKKIKNIPLILHTAYRVKLCPLINRVIICTDSNKIKSLCERNNFEVFMTNKKFLNGTERIASVADKVKADLIIDVHADEGILDPGNLAKLIKFHKKNKNFDIIVPHKKSLDAKDKNTVKLVFSKNKKIIYFSRAVTPFPFRVKGSFFHHLDIISFKPSVLKRFKNLKMSYLEKIEGIELLRAIENNYSLGTFEIPTTTFSINTPKDLMLAKKLIKKDKYLKKYIEKIKL
tara:strand:- start:4579 stop:5328 length:750 start_codon:yes stop_codon:yes gene_type:complete